jgi:integrase
MSAAFRPRLFDPAEPKSNRAPASASRGAPPLTAGAVIRRFLDDLEYRVQIDKVSAEHAANYRRSLEASKTGRYVGFIEVVGERPIGDLIQFDLTEWLRKNPQWKKPDSRLNNIAAVLACFHWAKSEGIMATCPYTKTRQLQEPRVQRRDATDEEADKVWAAASEQLRRIIWFVNAAGVRTKEARDLDWDQVNFQERIILIKIHKTRRTQLEPDPRVVGLDDEGWAELERWEANRRPNQTRVFLTPRGKVWTKNNLCQAFARLSVRCGLADDLTPYCFRHRYGTQAILAGATEREAGDGLGHKDSRSTRRYSHTANKKDHIKRVADKIGAGRKALADKRKPKKLSENCPLFEDLADE